MYFLAQLIQNRSSLSFFLVSYQYHGQKSDIMYHVINHFYIGSNIAYFSTNSSKNAHSLKGARDTAASFFC
jgi:hypothetical protein